MMSDDILDIEHKLKQTLEECDRLRKENEKLKSLLLSNVVKPASSFKKSFPKDKSDIRIQNQQNCKTEVLTEDKISLFRSLFRGREDVYAIHWTSRHGKSGYSPACANEWDPVLCKKPCSKCDNQKYLPVTDKVIRDHLIGKHTIGVYPLLSNETCYFLAADFDKDGWQDDIAVFMKICQDMEVPAIVERSRSGKGGHVWIFFYEAIPAALSRKLGSTILTYALETRHQLGLDSYDRFFPNQDTLPRGGFGNLIALPMQRAPMEKGNSIFIDDNFHPYPDQWQFLASVKMMNLSEVESIVRQSEKSQSIIGIRSTIIDDESDEDPWTLPLSKREIEKPLDFPFPDVINIVQVNLLYINKEGLSSQLVNRLKNIAAFQNPEFYRAQAMRLSTFGKPRIINCFEEFPKYIGLPRGCLNDVKSFLEKHKISLQIKDERYSGVPIDVQFTGTLRPEQIEGVSRFTQ